MSQDFSGEVGGGGEANGRRAGEGGIRPFLTHFFLPDLHFGRVWCVLGILCTIGTFYLGSGVVGTFRLLRECLAPPYALTDAGWRVPLLSK